MFEEEACSAELIRLTVILPTVNGEEQPIFCSMSDTVKRVKEIIRQSWSLFLCEKHELLFRGQRLEDSKQLSEYFHLENGSRLAVVSRNDHNAVVRRSRKGFESFIVS
jgi:hypothetical protein